MAGILAAVAGMISQINTGEAKIALPTNDDFASCELSIEELEAIAAGWPHWLKTIAHDVLVVSTYAVGAVGVALAIGSAFYTPKHPPLQQYNGPGMSTF